MDNSPIAAEEPGSGRDHIDLKERFDQLRPEILETLRMFPFFPLSFPNLPCIHRTHLTPSARPHTRLISCRLPLSRCPPTPRRRLPPFLQSARTDDR